MTVLTFFLMTADEVLDRDLLAEQYIFNMAAGDLSAMGKLYELIRTDVYAYALSKTANPSDAEDVVQDTFLRLWKYAARYSSHGKLMAWVFTVELNVIRKYASRPQAVELDHARTSFEESVEDSVIESELLRHLLHDLGENEREIVTLHVISGMKHREIAELLGKPLSTVLSCYNRAIKKLRVKIMEKGG